MWSLPYHLRAGRYQCFGQPNHKAAQTQSPARWRAGYINSRSMEDLNMRTYDLATFYRSTVGFDRFFSLLDQAASDGSPGYPPYNIERTGENTYRISVAVSGFSQGELSIVAKENTLTIKGEKSANENARDKAEVLYRGIAARAFERAFQLADFVVVKNASLENGPAPRRSRPRNPRGQEAPQHSDFHQRPGRAGGRRLGRQSRRLTRFLSRQASASDQRENAPENRGVFCRFLRHSGMVRRTRPQMCNCTSANLEIPGSRFARPGMTEQFSVALAPTTRAPAPSAFPASPGFAARRCLLRRLGAQPHAAACVD